MSKKERFQYFVIYGLFTIIAVVAITIFLAHDNASLTPYARGWLVPIWSFLYFLPTFVAGILLISIAQLHPSIHLCVSICAFIVTILLILWLDISPAILAFVMGILAALRVPEKK